MKLEYLKLKNFRQYYGEQTIRFACDSPRHVTVIHGINGAGKTSLFTALNWCLYGKDTGKLGEFVSKRAMNEHTGMVEAGVELCFKHENIRYVAERKRQGLLFEQNVLGESKETFLLSEIGMDGQFRRISNPDWKIGSILPAEAREYFFFDGEKIDNFTRPDHEHDVKKAVRTVLKIEAIERASTHLERVARDYRTELKKHTEDGRLQDLITQREKKQAGKDKFAEQLKELQGEAEAARTHKKDMDIKLNEIESSRQLSEERKRIEEDVNELQRQEMQLWLEIREIANRGFVSLAKPAIHGARNILEDKRQRGEIPSGIRETFLNDLLQEMQCICGRAINDGSDEHRNILEQLGRSVSSELEDTVLDTSSELNHLTLTIAKIPEELRNLWGQKRIISDRIQSGEGRVAEISEQLKDFDEAEVRRLEANRQKLRTTISGLEAEINRMKGRIEQIGKEIDDIDKEIVKAEASEEKAKHLQACVTLTTDAARATDAIYEQFAADMRKTIQDKVQEIFELLILKEGHFALICLGEDYKLDVIDRWDSHARLEMSAGERQVLSLAFIAGMATVAREEETFPLVMDTPFGRLSSDHRETITAHLPEIADQLVLFVTDEELRDQARSNLEPKIGAEYQLVFDQETSSTEIQKLQ